jgi:DHA1 family bicyclomycin/chloramphenicol resistance-like MFS transporter
LRLRGRLAPLASLAALGALATNIMLPAFPQMARELGVAPQQLTWTLSGFFVVFAIGRLFVGPLSDARGRAPFIIGGLAPDLIGGRSVQALGACAASVLARAVARDLYHGYEQHLAVAL